MRRPITSARVVPVASTDPKLGSVSSAKAGECIARIKGKIPLRKRVPSIISRKIISHLSPGTYAPSSSWKSKSASVRPGPRSKSSYAERVSRLLRSAGSNGQGVRRLSKSQAGEGDGGVLRCCAHVCCAAPPPARARRQSRLEISKEQITTLT